MTEVVNRSDHAYFEIDMHRKYRGAPAYLEVHPYFKMKVGPFNAGICLF